MNEAIFYFFYNLAGNSVFLNAAVVFLAEELPIVFVGVAIFFYWAVFQDPEDHRDFIEKHKSLVPLFFSGVIAYVLSSVLKLLIQAERPFVALSDVVALFPETGFAFPSSHAAVFSAMAFTMFARHKKSGLVFIVLAVLIGLARIAAGVHFPVDILGGFALGALIAYLLRNVYPHT